MKSRVLGSALRSPRRCSSRPRPAQAQVDPAGCTDDLQYDPSIPNVQRACSARALGVRQPGNAGPPRRRSDLQTYQRAVVDATQNNPRVRVIEKKMSDTALGQ